MKAVDIIKEGPECSFVSYRNGVLRYETTAGYVFDVPAAELGDAQVSAKERTATFLRWIKKQVIE